MTHQHRTCSLCQRRFINTCSLNFNVQNLTCGPDCRRKQRTIRAQQRRANARAKRIKEAATRQLRLNIHRQQKAA